MRKEHDFLGELEIPDDAYYGVQTMRALENFTITEEHLDKDFIVAMGMVKKAACMANLHTGRMPEKIGKALLQACDEVVAGKMNDQFPIDRSQGGAGTSCNMNINEVITNRALEIMGYARGRYDIISPNNHANMAQSTNDVFPTSIKVCLVNKSAKLIDALKALAKEFANKAEEFQDVLKMGRTHLQDAVPITVGQEMASYSSSIVRAVRRVEASLLSVYAVNMGATAVGTGLNAEKEYIEDVVKELSDITDANFYTAQNLVDATNNTDCFADVSTALKVVALVLIKMANDFRLMASGPRCGLNELKLPPRQPG
ncbi:MAG: aspartate ammonia-lyase, partial [Acidaminococcaceae bacterium]|nr:aspartate ammonia-lyase [Acidaminococcaceae bacterium]